MLIIDLWDAVYTHPFLVQTCLLKKLGCCECCFGGKLLGVARERRTTARGDRTAKQDSREERGVGWKRIQNQYVNQMCSECVPFVRNLTCATVCAITAWCRGKRGAASASGQESDF